MLLWLAIITIAVFLLGITLWVSGVRRERENLRRAGDHLILFATGTIFGVTFLGSMSNIIALVAAVLAVIALAMHVAVELIEGG